MRMLFATDGSRSAAVAEDFLLALPLGADDDVSVLTVPTVSEREGYALLSRVHWRLAARHIPVSTVMRRGAPAEAVAAVALERAAELVVVGSRGRGEWSGALLGSVSRAIAREVPASVLVVRATHDAPRRILLAVDGSEDARAAVRVMERLPVPSSVGVELLQLEQSDDGGRCDSVVQRARVVLGPRLARVSAAGWDHSGEAVLRQAMTARADLIVLGAAGQTVSTGLIGISVADHVLSHAHCAVLIAKPAVDPRRVVAPAFGSLALG